VLDLVYDYRNIEQQLGSKDKIDDWFEAKTRGLNDWQRDELKKHWGTMQKVLSSRSRMGRVVEDIVFDFATKPRLSSGRGNAILVASSIFEACRYFELLQQTNLKNRCALVTSYNPQTKDVTREETGANTESDKQFIYNTYQQLLAGIIPNGGMSKTETYEKIVTGKFIREPANMQLLVVVDKLLTGFDAPSCSYIYLDKAMRDHGLFQAICRTNRLDGDDKPVGNIVDYKDLFKSVQGAMAVYTSELDETVPGVRPDVLLQDRLTKGRERVDNALETLALLCEPVMPPKGELEYIQYFCGNTELSSDLEERESQRVALYKATADLVRSAAEIADEMEAAGYSPADISRINQERTHYLNVRDLIRMASGETLDLKPFEADMRHLIDTYIEASAPKNVSPFENMSLLEVIAKIGIQKAIQEQLAGVKNKDAIAETIENNVRKKIIKEQFADPVYYANMSALLDEIISARKAKSIEYVEYLKRVAEIAKKVQTGQAEGMPSKLNSPARRALWNNLDHDETLALRIDAALQERRPEGWRGVPSRERTVKGILYEILPDVSEVERVFSIVKAQAEY
jgi:type I restriction enzyme R subunit